MNKITRLIILIIVTLCAVWVTYPTFKWYFLISPEEKKLLEITQDALDTESIEIKQKVQELKKIRKRSLNLGLDLQGGVDIILQVNKTELSNKLMEQYEYDEDKVNSIFEKEYSDATERAIQILKNRMDSFGVSEPVIRKTFDGNISIELPGLNNPQLIREALSKVGKLEFKIVDEASMKILESYKLPMYHGALISRENLPSDFTLPKDSEWVSYWENDEFGIPKMMGWYILKSKVELDGTSIKNARPDTDRFGRPNVSFELTMEGADIFAELTENNIGKRLAIVLDNRVKNAPWLHEKIPGGQAQITGKFTYDETILLANILKAGSLPVKLDIVQEKMIGPSLGIDSIKDGSRAAIIGAILVVIFMIVYYKTSGVIAFISLLFNIFFLISLLSGLSATLTLSGIAGIALTIGMAVDANVIIYERIKEELKRSREIKHAIDNGFKYASSTIWDSNITTLIAALALFVFGSGSIKGFGITLIFGIIANIFSALFITRLIFDFLIEQLKFKKITM